MFLASKAAAEDVCWQGLLALDNVDDDVCPILLPENMVELG